MRHIHPTIITIGASIASIVFFFLVVGGFYWLALLAFLGTGLDAVDGLVARKYGKVTAFGGFLDSSLDRVADFFIISAFAFRGLVSWEVMTVLLSLSFLISYMRSRAELASASNAKFNVGLIERTPRLVLLFVGLLLYILFPSFVFLGRGILELVFLVLIVLSLWTVYQRISYAYKKL